MPTILERLEAMRVLLDQLIADASKEPDVPAPQPEPEEAEQKVLLSLTLPQGIGGEWEHGFSRLSNRITALDNPANRAALKAGNSIRVPGVGTFPIPSASASSNRLWVEYKSDKRIDGKKLEGVTIDVLEGAADTPADTESPAEAEVPGTDPKPEPTQPAARVGVMGTALGMAMGYPQLVPGKINQHWFMATEDDIIRAKSYGMSLFRVGCLRERIIKPGKKHELYLGEDDALPNIMRFLRLVKKHGCQAMLDLFHNYGGFSETNNAIKSGNPDHKKIGVSGGPSYDTFANDWKAIIEYIQTDADAWDAVYGIDTMNEFVGLPNDNVFFAQQKFLDVCAPIMGNKLAILEGNAYSNTPNFWDHNSRFKDLKDPRGKGFIEMSGHLYADADYSGSYKTGDTVRKGENFDTFYVNRLKPFLDGCEKYGFKASIGEWIVPGDHPNLLEGSRKGIEYGLKRGCNFIVFGMGRGYSKDSSNHWNLEIPRNKPTLEVVKKLAAFSKSLTK